MVLLKDNANSTAEDAELLVKHENPDKKELKNGRKRLTHETCTCHNNTLALSSNGFC